MLHNTKIAALMGLTIGCLAGQTAAQDRPRTDAAPGRYKMTTEIPGGVAAPSKVETPLRDVELF